jgi:hypothetical protein
MTPAAAGSALRATHVPESFGDNAVHDGRDVG